MSDHELLLRRVNDTLFTATLDGVEVGRASVAIGHGVWEFYSTVTAPAYEGRGIASKLVRFALAAAEEAGVTVIPSCWYVDGLMQRSSPRFDHLRAGHRAPDQLAGDACRVAPAVLPRPQ
jgi:predicted GNAT family acetyltransferase